MIKKKLLLAPLCLLISSSVVSCSQITYDTNISQPVSNIDIYESTDIDEPIDEELEKKVIPYQELVDRLNDELGSHIRIPKNKETYEKIIKVSLEDTEICSHKLRNIFPISLLIFP